jgi:DNA-binding NtrC family response regulator
MSEGKDATFDIYGSRNECESAKKALKREFGLKQIIGGSKVVKELHEKINRISTCDVSVLISGESGTGAWPGNIRELENKIQQLVVMSTSSVISARDIQLSIGKPPAKEIELEYFKEAKKRVIDAFEKTYLTCLLTEHRDI